MKRTLHIILGIAAALCLAACSPKDGKTKALWICCDANFQRLSSKDSICHYLDKAKECGFNEVVVDVKGSCGYVLYRSDFIPSLTASDGFSCERDWDYLEYFIEESHRRGLKITVSVTPFAVGTPCLGIGPVYDNPALKEWTCTEYTPSGMLKIEDDPSQVSAFLNPVLPQTREYALNTMREVLSRYSFDGLCLDYCRYPDEKSDFSQASRLAFEEYLGHEIENFPADIFSYDENGARVPGRYYKEWWTFRASVIKDYVKSIRELRDELQSGVKIEYWAASWLHALYPKGQNWGSEEAVWHLEQDWATEDYAKTGFAELLDVFISGTYLERVRGIDDNESIEYGLWRTNRDCCGKCSVQGSLYAVNHLDEFADACTLCLEKTDGLMVFDLVHVINNNLWDDIKTGIDNYRKQ